MRINLIKEAEETEFLWWVLEGAITWPEKGVPITYQFDWSKDHGVASNFERSDEGVISCEVEFFEDTPEEYIKKLEPTFMLRYANWHDYKGLMFVESGSICQVSFNNPLPGFPENVFKENNGND